MDALANAIQAALVRVVQNGKIGNVDVDTDGAVDIMDPLTG